MISVIIPLYNQAEYLSECVKSVLDQKVQGELIIIDDGSTDAGLEIAKKYQSERPDIVRVISQTNRGLASARNTGIMNAKFEWVLPLDADDKLEHDALERLIACLKYTSADVIAPSFKTFGTTNEPITLMSKPRLEDFRTGNRIGYCALIKKSSLLAVGGYSSKMIHGYEDLHLWINFLVRGFQIITTPESLWFYRTKEKSMWTDALGHHKELIAQINQDFPQAQLNF